MIRVSVQAIVTGALKELNAISSGSAPQAELMTDGVELLNQIFDDWNAQRGMMYAELFEVFTLQTGGNPTTIGPGGDFNFTQRPVDIDGIQIILTGGTPNPYVYCRKRDKQWWQTLSSPTTTASYPTDFYYDPTWDPGAASPLGSIYFWPPPTTAYQCQVWMRGVLAQVTANTTMSLPPGYAYAMRMELAGRGSQAWRKPWTSQQQDARIAAVEKVMANNNNDPMRIMTRDAGMPGSPTKGLPNFFWPSGLMSGR
jgi:hypothetical protein